MPRWGKAASENDAFFGFVAAILIMGGLFIWLLTDIIWAVPLFLFITGMLTVFDTLYPYGRQMFAISWTGGIITGCFAVLFANAYGFLYWLVATAIIAFFLHLLVKLARRLSR
jgi:hypothetical protein